MKILWFSPTPSLFDKKVNGGWIASLEYELAKIDGINLAIAFEYDNPTARRYSSGNVTYYPMNVHCGLHEKINIKLHEKYKWEKLEQIALGIIQDFHPDIIQCFGTEWPYGLLYDRTDIPIVIHMQGFLNVDDAMEDLCLSPSEQMWYSTNRITTLAKIISHLHKRKQREKNELEIVKNNRYFLGRTHWDKEIINSYNPLAEYFRCNEILRHELRSKDWRYNVIDKPTILTVSQGGLLKGNEIILRTAEFLTNTLKLSFTWRVAGNTAVMKLFENKTGIKCSSVNILQLGMIDASTVAEEICSANVFVHPSIIDNSPNSICEAQYIGCPVIASNVGGVSSLIEDGFSGLLYPYNEYHTLAYKIIRLLADQKLMYSLSENEKAIARQRHNPHAIVTNLCGIYETIIQKSGEKHEI